MCLNVLSACRFVHPCCAVPQRSEEGVRFPWNCSSPGIGITDGSQLPYGCWGSNPGPLQEQLALLTARPSLQPPYFPF